MNRLSLPKLELDQTRLLNAIAGRRRTLSFEAAGAQWIWRFLPWLSGFTPSVKVAMKTGNEPVQIELEALPEPARCGAQFADVVLADLPQDVWLAVLDAALEPLLDKASLALHVPVELVSIGSSSAGPVKPGELYFELSRAGEPLLTRGRLVLDTPGLQRLAALLGPVPGQANGDGFSLVPFPARLVMGETHLAAGEFLALERGDIVLLDRHAGSESRLYDLVFSDTVRYRARQQDGRLILDRMATDTAPTPTAPAPGAASLDTLPVHLVFEAGHKQLTLAELKQLEPGYTFELDQPADRQLTIRANGQPVGVGELVQIGDRLGVRVLEWIKPVTPAKA